MWWPVAVCIGVAVAALLFFENFEFFIPQDKDMSDEESR